MCFRVEFDRQQDIHSSAWFAFLSATRSTLNKNIYRFFFLKNHGIKKLERRAPPYKSAPAVTTKKTQMIKQKIRKIIEKENGDKGFCVETQVGVI
jgi:hypothetical protein